MKIFEITKEGIVILLIEMLIVGMNVSAQTNYSIKGDVNGDMLVDAADVKTIEDVIMKKKKIGNEKVDVNNDDKVNAADIVKEVNILKRFPEKAHDYNRLFKGTIGDSESFIFFSDPHWCVNYSSPTINKNGENYLQTIKQYYDYTPTKFVICGGDWLNSHKKTVAIKYLKYVDSIMNIMFPNSYYLIYGNHDNNYQGELDDTDDTSANDGALSNQQVLNLMFGKWNSMYYTFLGSNSRFYVFDSGIDWITSMNSYKWEQVDWFANQLLLNTDDNIIITTHIADLSCKDPSTFGNNITPIINNVLLIAEAFNSRSSIILNGITYDFSSKKGKVRCLLCGHIHMDAVTTVHNIPLLSIDDAINGNFDLILVDYVTNKLYTIRVGTGENRTIDLAQ